MNFDTVLGPAWISSSFAALVAAVQLTMLHSVAGIVLVLLTGASVAKSEEPQKFPPAKFANKLPSILFLSNHIGLLSL